MRLVIPIQSGEQLSHIYKAESHLLKAGVTFDTSSDIIDEKVVNRIWSFDWSLEGATIGVEIPEVAPLA